MKFNRRSIDYKTINNAQTIKNGKEQRNEGTKNKGTNSDKGTNEPTTEARKGWMAGTRASSGKAGRHVSSQAG